MTVNKFKLIVEGLRQVASEVEHLRGLLMAALPEDGTVEMVDGTDIEEGGNNRIYTQDSYTSDDIAARYGVSKGTAQRIMREARWLCGGEGYNGKLGKRRLHYTELAKWDQSPAAARVVGGRS